MGQHDTTYVFNWINETRWNTSKVDRILWGIFSVLFLLNVFCTQKY